MIPYLREGIGALAGAALAGCIALVVYEGVPIIKSVPFIEYVPIIGELAEGRVDREARKAREGYVAEARLIAAEAQLAERNRQLAAGRRALDGFAGLLADAQARESALSEQDAKDDAQFEAGLKAAGRSCSLTDDDIRWLRR